MKEFSMQKTSFENNIVLSAAAGFLVGAAVTGLAIGLGFLIRDRLRSGGFGRSEAELDQDGTLVEDMVVHNWQGF